MDPQNLLQNILWDYSISALQCYNVLLGTQKKAGHYDQYNLFKKLLESYPWFVIMEIVPMRRIKELLTEQLIDQLRSNLLRNRYEYILDRLSRFV